VTDPFTAYLGIKAARAWVPYAVGGGLGLVVGIGIAVAAWVWQGREIDSLAGQLTAMTDQRDTARQSRDMAAADAQRWMAASEARSRVIEARNAEIEAQRADLIATEMLLDQANEAADREAADLKAKIRTLKEKADANPDQVRPLGPIARDAAKLLQSR